MIKVWFHIDLNKEDADIFMEYLREMKIRFEPSENYNLVHIACFMNNNERKDANRFLRESVYEGNI